MPFSQATCRDLLSFTLEGYSHPGNLRGKNTVVFTDRGTVKLITITVPHGIKFKHLFSTN